MEFITSLLARLYYSILFNDCFSCGIFKQIIKGDVSLRIKVFNDFLSKTDFIMATKRKKAVDIFWRIYFFVYVISFIIGMFSVVFEKNLWTCSIQIKIIDFIFCMVGIIGLFAYTYEKNIFKAIFWQLFFLVLLIWHVYLNVFVMPATTIGNRTVLDFMIADLSFHTPLYLAMFLYAFKSQR